MNQLCILILRCLSSSASPLLQVALRWIIQRNATFTTSASTLAYFSEDLDLFDFTLTPAEMETLDAK